MKKILLIDDLRNFKPEIELEGELIVTRTSAEALAYLEANPDAEFASIWFDHDLGMPTEDVIDTTMPVLDHLAYKAFTGEPVDVEMVYVHTSNRVGRDQIVASLTNYGYRNRKVDASAYFYV